MVRNKWKKRLLLGMAALVAVAILVLIVGFGNRKEKDRIRVGFIISGSIRENGWNGMHYQGIKAACDKLGVELLIKENVAEGTGQCEPALRQLAEEGAQMIFLSSYGYSEEVLQVVEAYPEIVFCVNSSEYHTDNMTSYFARMYQARYLAGIIAGMRTESGRIGYVAAMSNNEVNRGISAFTLGVKRVNPDAKVIVAWTGTWDDKEKEQDMADRLIREKKVDVLTCHQNQAHVIETAEAAGIDSIGYHMASEGLSEHYLTAVVCNWELVYRQMIREFLQGKGNSQDNYWIGLKQGAVALSDYSGAVSKEIKNEVKQAKEEILSGKDIFSGEIYDRDGTLRCGENETISDEMLLEQFDWYVEGVEFYEE
ncbi:MAG: BMP family ABC transporter substrate-binding protein [Lachnospiraceae bacterium]|nr:BMP family ABC transporter substrate-binding protein [Lachnospiraceae bacterium]